jgi:uncharacterized protein
VIENLLLAVAGLIGGFIAGLTGIGTGFIMLAVIPLALHHFGVPESYYVSVTVANAIFATLISSIANILTSLRNKAFYLKETLWVAASAVLFSVVIFELVVKSSLYSRNFFNAVVVVFMFVVILQIFRKLRLSNPQDEHSTTPRLLLTGGLSGAVASLTGLGGGTVIIPMLNLWQKVDILKAKSISFGTIFATCAGLSINNLLLEPPNTIPMSQGLIVLPMIIPIGIGVLLGSPLGILTSQKISGRSITLIFLSVLCIVTIQKIAELVWLD